MPHARLSTEFKIQFEEKKVFDRLPLGTSTPERERPHPDSQGGSRCHQLCRAGAILGACARLFVVSVEI